MKNLFPEFDRRREVEEVMVYKRCGNVIDIQGNLFTVDLPDEESVTQNEECYLMIEFGGEKIPLKSEVIKVVKNNAYCQCFEETLGARIGDEVRFAGMPLFAELGPGLLGGVTDGLQNPLYDLYDMCGVKLQRGVYLNAIDREKMWDFTPGVNVGDVVRAGDWLGSVPEGPIKHQIMVPFSLREEYTVKEIAPAGERTAKEVIAKIEDERGEIIDVTMIQRWPIKQPLQPQYGDEQRLKRQFPSELMETGFRIVDAMLPVAKGGTFAIPGPFGSGKTVFQQTVARYATVDIIIVAACGERANEAVDVLTEFPELQDPRTGRSLMERTFIICNTSSMPTAARESSLYLAITVGEYFRMMGVDAMVLADSTSRWAQALREMSARLEEIPGEEAFPVYIAPMIAALYERAGVYRHPNGEVGTLTIGGSVSPAGGNLQEPVTEATKAVVFTFLALSRDLGSRRIFPAIDPRVGMSYSGYIDTLKDYFSKNVDPEWIKNVRRIKEAIEAGAKAADDIALMGERNVDDRTYLDYLKGNLIRDVFLVQNSFHPIDATCPLDRMNETMKLVMTALDISEKPFEEKEQARDFFTQLINNLYQRNFAAQDDADYAKLGEKATELLAEKGQVSKVGGES
ncbi:V-type ATP synthase subunit A [Candidatus Hydrogenedentota bacterium]